MVENMLYSEQMPLASFSSLAPHDAYSSRKSLRRTGAGSAHLPGNMEATKARQAMHPRAQPPYNDHI
jgi:hypothetical protein